MIKLNDKHKEKRIIVRGFMKFEQFAETDWKSEAQDVLFIIRDVFQEKYTSLADPCLDSLAENYAGEDAESFIDALGQELSSLKLLLYVLDNDSDSYCLVVIGENERKDFEKSTEDASLVHQERRPLGKPAKRIDLAQRIKYETYTLPKGYDRHLHIPEYFVLSYEKNDSEGEIIERGSAFLSLKAWPPVLQQDIHYAIHDLLQDKDGKYYAIVGNTTLNEEGYLCDHREFIVSGDDFEHATILHEENAHVDTPRGAWYYISWELGALHDTILFVVQENKKEHTKTLYGVSTEKAFHDSKKELFCVDDTQEISLFKCGADLYLAIDDEVYRWNGNCSLENKFERVCTVNGLSAGWGIVPLGETKIAFQVRPKGERLDDKVGELSVFDLSNTQCIKFPCYYGFLNKLSEDIVCVSKVYPTSKQPILEAFNISTCEKRILKYGAINDNGFTKIVHMDYGHVLVSDNKLFMVKNLWEQMKAVN